MDFKLLAFDAIPSEGCCNTAIDIYPCPGILNLWGPFID